MLNIPFSSQNSTLVAVACTEYKSWPFRRVDKCWRNLICGGMQYFKIVCEPCVSQLSITIMRYLRQFIFKEERFILALGGSSSWLRSCIALSLWVGNTSWQEFVAEQTIHFNSQETKRKEGETGVLQSHTYRSPRSPTSYLDCLLDCITWLLGKQYSFSNHSKVV
jgi:hypothetical protein